jgi:hypothetical protein
MAQQAADHAVPALRSVSRRTVLGLALAAGVFGPLIGASAASADTATSTVGASDGRLAEEEYEIPDGIGSAPWW